MKALAGSHSGAAGRGLGGGVLAHRLFRRPRPRTVAVGLVALVVLIGIWLWVRDSPLVAVDRVDVTGATGPDAGAIRAALSTAARGMTTLDVDQAQLRAAVAPYPEVKSVRVSAELPHGLRIQVTEQLAVAQVLFDGRSEAVTADGILLGSQRTAGLPQIVLVVAPGGTRVSDSAARAGLRALSAAPYQLLSRISRVKSEPGHGVVAQLHNGPAIYLGDGGQLHAKWLAVAAVLADPGSAGASYIDVTDPARPAAGAVTGAATTSGGSSSAASTAASTTSPISGGRTLNLKSSVIGA